MRDAEKNGAMRALAVAGNYVVLLGWDLPQAQVRSEKILGFAIQRHRKRDGEVIWLGGMKTFEAIEPHPAQGVMFSSFNHPFQTFQWADYSVSPDQKYSFRIVAMGGEPGDLEPKFEVTLKVKTERVTKGKHAVFFNRGAIASQEYARRFQNKKPSEVGPAAYEWLSRGLIEGLESYIDQTKAGDRLRGAFYEFQNTRIFDRLEAARGRGVDVKILYDGDSAGEQNTEALENQAIAPVTKPREHSGGFAHNKFLVFIRDEEAKQVWTGSTNLTENGIFGHSNNAHIVRDETLAGHYLAYWNLLDRDLTLSPTATQVELQNLLPVLPENTDTETVFSPRSSLTALDWYADLAASAERGLFMTFAFGMNGRFVKTYDQVDNVLRFALMEKKGNGRQYKKQAAEIDRIRRHPNIVVSVGARVALNNFDRWLAETAQVSDDAHVLYVHTKYMLVDPLGPSPTLVVGSANFSEGSTNKNDENMLIIRGNGPVADIYLGEFMRLFTHYSFREALARQTTGTRPQTWKPNFLVPSPGWVDGFGPGSSYYNPGTDRFLRRLYFSGQ